MGNIINVLQVCLYIANKKYWDCHPLTWMDNPTCRCAHQFRLLALPNRRNFWCNEKLWRRRWRQPPFKWPMVHEHKKTMAYELTFSCVFFRIEIVFTLLFLSENSHEYHMIRFNNVILCDVHSTEPIYT